MALPPVFPLPPGGADPIETYGYLTDVLDSYDGHEQRVALREIPQSGLEYPVLAPGALEAQVLASILETGLGQEFAVPIWQHFGRLQQDAATGSLRLYVPSDPDNDFIWGGPFGWWFEPVYAVLWADALNVEVQEIDYWDNEYVGGVIVATFLQLKAGPARDWPAGSIVMPGLAGRLAIEVGEERHGPAVRAARVAFTMRSLSA